MREAHRVSEVINHLNLLENDFILITDGRFSGASGGFIIGYLSPEAAEPDSLLALVQDGDQIQICLRTCRIDLLVEADELERRHKTMARNLQRIPNEHSYLHRYRASVGPAHLGALLSDGATDPAVVHARPFTNDLRSH
jgi:dihydroxy-acid dehydratase